MTGLGSSGVGVGHDAMGRLTAELCSLTVPSEQPTSRYCGRCGHTHTHVAAHPGSGGGGGITGILWQVNRRNGEIIEEVFWDAVGDLVGKELLYYNRIGGIEWSNGMEWEQLCRK